MLFLGNVISLIHTSKPSPFDVETLSCCFINEGDIKFAGLSFTVGLDIEIERFRSPSLACGRVSLFVNFKSRIPT